MKIHPYNVHGQRDVLKLYLRYALTLSQKFKMTGDQMKSTVTVNNVTDFSGFKH